MMTFKTNLFKYNNYMTKTCIISKKLNKLISSSPINYKSKTLILKFNSKTPINRKMMKYY